jgi:hypothetical protein
MLRLPLQRTTHSRQTHAPLNAQTIRRAPLLSSRPRINAGLHQSALWGKSSDHVDPELTEWARTKMKALVVDTAQIDEHPEQTDTTLAAPWRIALVPAHRLEFLRYADYPCAGSSTMLWGIGPERSVANCNPHDVNPAAIDSERSSSRPGNGPFRHVARGAYGNRNFKYLWAIDHRGMHIAREMTPCKLSSRGIITHSILVDRGVIGGEIFFDLHDLGKVFVNFGSARLPLEERWQAEKTAEFVLALGYHTVVAMIPDRNLRDAPYGMADRYGNGVQNMVFRQEDPNLSL